MALGNSNNNTTNKNSVELHILQTYESKGPDFTRSSRPPTL